MKIIPLNKETALANINRLIEINKELDLDPWTVDNFLIDLDGKWRYSLIALENDQIVGFLICSVKENNTLHIHKIAIVSKYQRRGVGTLLMKHLFSNCNEYNIKYISVKTKKNNVNAQRFYERQDFKRIGSDGPNYVYKKEMK